MSTLPTNPADADNAAVSFEEDILPLFRPMDIQCMRGRAVFLADYAYMSTKDPDGSFKNALNVLASLKGTNQPQMPFGGPYWSDESIDLFQSWIDDGCNP